MARRKNVKRIDPRYFLHETVNRGEELEEAGSRRELHAGAYVRRKMKELGDLDKVLERAPGDPSVGKHFLPFVQAAVEKEKQKGAAKPTGTAAADDFQRDMRRAQAKEKLQQIRKEKFQQKMGQPGDLGEGCPLEEPGEGGEAIDISAPGMEVHVDDISQLSPEEAFAAGMASARDAIDQVMGGSQENQPREEERLEEGTEPKEESLLRMLWDMLMTKKYDRYDERDPVSYERERDREGDEEQAARDIEHRKRNPVPDAPETYGRPHALKTVTEAKGPPQALGRWAEMFPKAADALGAVLAALAGEEIPGVVKHDRTPAEIAQDRAEAAAGVEKRGPRPPNTWGKYEEGKKK